MFSRLTPEQARRRWFPKFTLTFLEPIRLQVEGNLKGKARRIAAGERQELLDDLGLDLIMGPLARRADGGLERLGLSESSQRPDSEGALGMRSIDAMFAGAVTVEGRLGFPNERFEIRREPVPLDPAQDLEFGAQCVIQAPSGDQANAIGRDLPCPNVLERQCNAGVV